MSGSYYSLTGLNNIGGIAGNIFCNKISIVGTQTSYLSSSTIDVTGNINLDLHIPTADASNNGLLSSADWTTFNSKEEGLTFQSPLLRTTNTVSLPDLTISKNTLALSSNFMGFQVGTGYTGSNSIAIGTNTFKNTSSGDNNLLIGNNSANHLTTGSDNCCVGHQALYGTNNINTGNNNAIFGHFNYSDNSPTDMSNVCIVGTDNDPEHSGVNIIGQNITSVANNSTYINNIRNVLKPNFLFHDPSSNEITDYELDLTISQDTVSLTNNFMGYEVGTGYTGLNTIAIGTNSLKNASSGSNNIVIGNSSGNHLTTGGNNCCIGHQVLYGTSNVDTAVNNSIFGHFNYSDVSPTDMSNVCILGFDNDPEHSGINIIGQNIASLYNNSTYVNNIRDASSSTVLYYDPSTKEITYNASGVPTSLLSENNTWTGTNFFNNDVSMNVAGTGLTNSPKLSLTLPDWATQVNDIDNLNYLTQTSNNKCFSMTRFDNQKNSHYPRDINDADFSFTTPTEIESLDGAFIYTSTLLTANRTIFLPTRSQFSLFYPSNYACNFSILSAPSALNNFNYQIDVVLGIYTNLSIYVNQVLITAFPYTLNRLTQWVCEVESVNTVAGVVVVYNFRSLEKTPTYPNLQQVLNTGNTSSGQNIDISNGSLLATVVGTDVLGANTLTNVDVISDLALFNSIALKYYGDVKIQQGITTVIDTSGASLRLLPSDIKLQTIPSATKPSIIYYDTTTKSVSYGLNKADDLTGGVLGSIPYQSSANNTSFLPIGGEGRVLTVASGVPSWQFPSTQSIYGDGADGAVHFNNSNQYPFATFNGIGSYTLIRDVWATTIMVDSLATVITGGYRMFAQTSLTNNGTIHNNGSDGNGTVGGAGGLGGFFKAGGNGAVGLLAASAGANGTAQATPTADTWVGGLGGKGAQGRASNTTFTGGMITTANLDLSVPSNADGGSKVTSNFVNYMMRYIVGATNWQMTPSIGGGSGAKSTTGTTATSGGGGGGGGICVVASPIISGFGSISAYGGYGGNAAGTGGNFGGGGGGGGGICAVICRSITNTYSAGGGPGGATIYTGTGDYPLATANGTNTTLTGTLTLIPTQALSKGRLYMLTFHLQKTGGIGGSGINGITGYGMTWTLINGSRVEYNSILLPTRVQETWYGYYTNTEPDLIENRAITIALSDINTTARVIIDEITNVEATSLNNPVNTGNYATNSSDSATTLTVTLPFLPPAGNMVYSVFTRSGGTAPVAGANNTLVNNQTVAPIMVSEVNTTGQQANAMSHTTAAAVAGFSVEIAQTTIGANSGSDGWNGKVVRIFG